MDGLWPRPRQHQITRIPTRGLRSPGIAVAKGIIMNKLTKAAIAGGVGIALLLGGAGTLATWNSSTNISGGTIVAGRLAVGTPSIGTWTVAHLNPLPATTYGTAVALSMSSTGALTVTSNNVAFAASPGDQLTYVTTVPITAVGTNLVATLALTPGSIVPTTSTTANNALASFLAANTAVSMSGNGISGNTPNYTINGALGVATTATVTATITFSSAAITGNENAAMLGSVNFSGMALSLTQNS